MSICPSLFVFCLLTSAEHKNIRTLVLSNWASSEHINGWRLLYQFTGSFVTITVSQSISVSDCKGRTQKERGYDFKSQIDSKELLRKMPDTAMGIIGRQHRYPPSISVQTWHKEGKAKVSGIPSRYRHTVSSYCSLSIPSDFCVSF